jgi:type IV pilus assembly protein PilO
VSAFLFVCDFVLCGYVPAQKRLKTLQEARVRQRQRIEMARAQEAELPALRERLADVRATAERYGVSVPTQGALGAFLQNIATLMSRHDLTDHMVAPGDPVEGAAQSSIPMEVTCRGSLVNLFSFFQDLQNLPRLVRVGRVTLQNDAGFTGQVTMRLEAAVFYQSPNQAVRNASAGTTMGGMGNEAG